MTQPDLFKNERVEKQRLFFFSVLSSAMLLIAVLSRQPYGFYQAIRWVICANLVWLAVHIYKEHEDWYYPLLYVILAIIFNPIAPFHFDRGVWLVLDAAALLLIALPALGFVAAFKKKNY